ncbi:MAG TPA: hypothetical protein VHF47_12125, partial [Acidimicrobiales bacterium]|nr:hypothetical protein [Acidimicrobiales bacterium]
LAVVAVVEAAAPEPTQHPVAALEVHAVAAPDGGVTEGGGQERLADTHRDRDTLQHLRRLLPCDVRVTSAVHPLFGRVLQATGFKRWDGALLLVVVLPDGSPGTIPANATDVLGSPPEAPVVAVLSVEGVRQLRTLLDALGPRRASRKSPRTRK